MPRACVLASCAPSLQPPQGTKARELALIAVLSSLAGGDRYGGGGGGGVKEGA